MSFSFLLPGCPRTYRLSHSHLQRFSFRLEKEEVDGTAISECPCSLVPQKCGGLSQDTGFLERSLDHDKQWGAVQGHTVCGAGDGGLGSCVHAVLSLAGFLHSAPYAAVMDQNIGPNSELDQ